MVKANITEYVRDGEPIEKTLRRFNGKCEKLQVISDMKKKRHYIKPSDVKKEKKKKAIRAQKRIIERDKVNY